MAENEIDVFYKAKSGELIRFCEVILHNRMISDVDAEDIVQRVVVKAWEKRHKLATHPNLWGWFSNACVKECAMLSRSNAYKRTHFGWPVPLAENMLMDEEHDVILRWWTETEATETLAELKKQLTPLEQKVYEQYYVQEKSAQETAETLNIKVNAVNDAARRIRKRASKMKLCLLILSLSPIYDVLCSILDEGRQWK